MKKITSLILCIALCLCSAAILASADAMSYAAAENPVFEIVAPITNAEAGSEASHGKVVYSGISALPDGSVSFIERVYEDGALIVTPLTDEEFADGYFIFADRYFPAYLNKRDENKIVKEESTSDSEKYTATYYLLEMDGTNVKSKTPLYVHEARWDGVGGNAIYKFTTDENGKEVKIPLDGSPFTDEEFQNMCVGSPYNDGLIYKDADHENGSYIPGYFDMNGRCVRDFPQTSYFEFYYNMGYIVEISNNGGVIDWSLPDAESQRVYETKFIDVTTMAEYDFKDVRVESIYDNAYGIASVKGADGQYTLYLIKLKKPPVVTVDLDGTKVPFDQMPVIENGRTLVPLRAIFESLGAGVMWDAETKTIIAQKGDTIVILTVGSPTAFVNEKPVTLDVPAKIVNGRTLVPVRFIADSFGVNTDWDAAARQVKLTTK